MQLPLVTDVSSSQSLALYQEYIELDLFHYGLAKFSTEEFDAANITADDRFLLEFMADQEVGHANLITNILGREVFPIVTPNLIADFESFS